jgi:hypothetical protein
MKNYHERLEDHSDHHETERRNAKSACIKALQSCISIEQYESACNIVSFYISKYGNDDELLEAKILKSLELRIANFNDLKII